MSDALDAAIRAAMDEQGCERSECDSIDLWEVLCERHETPWDVRRHACLTIADAVMVGFEAGRRDALTQAADMLDVEGAKWTDQIRLATFAAADDVRDLLSTTEESKP